MKGGAWSPEVSSGKESAPVSIKVLSRKKERTQEDLVREERGKRVDLERGKTQLNVPRDR